MKARLVGLTIITSLVLMFSGCSQDGEVENLQVTSVERLYEPDDGKEVVLQSSASATLYFEWEPAKAEDSGMVLYEIAFDKPDGDFSNPFFTMPSDNNGGYNHATISHKQLNKIAAMMGVESSKQGTFKWTVISSKGINPVKAKQERTLTVTRLAGFADAPAKVYLTGEGTEVGADLSKALIMKSTAEGEFEIYSQLTAGKTYQFVDGISGTPRTFYSDGELLKEGGTATVAKTGIYKVALDFTTGVCTYKEVLKVSLFVNSPQVEIELPYKALGVWELTNHTITDITDNDDRYKFRMESSEGETEWRAPNNDSKPSGKADYYYMVEKTNVEQWTNGQIWKSPSTTGWSDKTYDITFILKADGPYTHNLVIK